MKLAPIVFLIVVSIFNVSPLVAEPLEKVNVQLAWKHQFQFAGMYAALEQGFYKKAGLDVTLIEGGPGISCSEKMLSDKVNYCTAAGGDVVRRRVAGEKIVVLASIIQHSPVALLTLKESGLESPKSLIGKRVESQLAGEPRVEIKAMFKRQGIDLAKLDNRENAFSLDPLINKEVDAKYVYISNEPYLLDLAGVEYNLIRPKDYGVDFYGDVLLTSEEELEQHEDRAIRFREATIEGWRFALNYKALVIDHIYSDYSKLKTRQALLAEANAIDMLMLPNLIEVGHNNHQRWEAIAATLASNNVIKQGYSLDGLIYDAKPSETNKSLLIALGSALIIFGVGLVGMWIYNRRLAQKVKQQAKSEDLLRDSRETAIEQAYTDELSGMGNRRSCYEFGEHAVEHAKETKTPISILMIDIDHFKQINDVHGHAIGDEVICTLANVIVERIRGTDIQGRIGGEEFAVILPDTDIEGSQVLAEKIRAELENLSVVAGKNIVKVTASFGISDLKASNDDINVIMKRADEALYQAKEGGRNQVVAI